MEKNQNPGLIKSTMTYGAILGAIIVVYSFIIFILKIMPVGILLPIILFIISITIYFTGLYVFTKKTRDTQLGGYMTFGQGVMIGILISFFAAIISSFYTYIQNQFIDPDYMPRVFEAQKNWLVSFMNGKVPDEKIDELIARVDESIKGYKPAQALFQGIAGTTLMGALVALITSAILKKKPTPFDGRVNNI